MLRERVRVCVCVWMCVGGANRCVCTRTCGCAALPEGKSFSQPSAQTVNLGLTSQKHQDTA